MQFYSDCSLVYLGYLGVHGFRISGTAKAGIRDLVSCAVPEFFVEVGLWMRSRNVRRPACFELVGHGYLCAMRMPESC